MPSYVPHYGMYAAFEDRMMIECHVVTAYMPKCGTYVRPLGFESANPSADPRGWGPRFFFRKSRRPQRPRDVRSEPVPTRSEGRALFFVAAMSSSPVAGGDTGATPANMPASLWHMFTLHPGTMSFCRMSEFPAYG